MDEEDRHRQEVDRTRRREQDLADLQNEIAGREVGRAKRFLPGEASPAAERKRRKEAAERLSALSALLRDSDYAARYTAVMDRLQQAEAATEIALAEAQNTLANAENQLKEVMSRASTLPDGTKVFRDDDGNVWTETGERVRGAVVDSIVWRDHAPSYEAFLARRKATEDAQARVDAILRYQIEVLGHARDRLTDEENPPDKDALDDIAENIEREMPPEVRAIVEPTTEPPSTDPQSAGNFKLPPIGQ